MVDFLLQQDGPGVEPFVGPEDGEAGLGLAVDDRPVDGAGAPVPGQQRRVILDGAQRRVVEDGHAARCR